MQKLLNNSLIYLGSSLGGRVISIILLPLITRYISPTEYGIWGLTNAVSQFISVAITFGMLMAVSRFYFDAQSNEERKTVLGTIVIFLLTAPLAMSVLLELIGPYIFVTVLPNIPYNPYLRITIWTTYISVFSIVPLMVLRSQEKAITFALLSVGQIVLYQLLALFLVVFLNYGVLGLLLSNLLSTALLLPFYISITFRVTEWHFSTEVLKKVLAYSLPLIPHGFAGWVLMLSDRLILQHWFPLASVGIYSLGYTIGSTVQAVADAGNTAWFPTFFQAQTKDADKTKAIQSATYLVAAVCATVILIIVGSHHFIIWFLPTSYHQTKYIIFWIATSSLAIIIYYIWSFSIHYSKKTYFLSIATWSGAVINVGLNVIFIPKLGHIAAAINTTISYIVMALLCGVFAYKVYYVQYEYQRWLCLISVTVVLGVTSSIRPNLSLSGDIIYSIATLSAWPILLWFIQFYSSTELEILQKFRERTALRLMEVLK